MKKIRYLCLVFGFTLVENTVADLQLDKITLPPVAKLDPHGAALGLAFYTGDMFPAEYKNRLFITQHGSWNRTEKIGYRILVLEVQPDGRVVDNKVFAAGWLQGQEVWGRPNDVMVMPDGALLVSDDLAGVIYRISYTQ
jgi:glucose/arabinose dehydrogenase